VIDHFLLTPTPNPSPKSGGGVRGGEEPGITYHSATFFLKVTAIPGERAFMILVNIQYPQKIRKYPYHFLDWTAGDEFKFRKMTLSSAPASGGVFFPLRILSGMSV
jgi:hypothetical protein